MVSVRENWKQLFEYSFNCTNGFLEKKLCKTFLIRTLPVLMVFVREKWVQPLEDSLCLYQWFLRERVGYNLRNTHSDYTHCFCERKLGTTLGILTLTIPMVSVRESCVKPSEYPYWLYPWLLWVKVEYNLRSTHIDCNHGCCEGKLGTTFWILILTVPMVSMRESWVQPSEYSLCLYRLFLWKLGTAFWIDTLPVPKFFCEIQLDTHDWIHALPLPMVSLREKYWIQLS